jgi:hypothetical protein
MTSLDSSPLDGRQLPQPGRLISRLRDLIVVDLPSADTKPRPTMTRTAILFTEDKQADPRVIDVLTAFHYRSLKYRVHLLALAKVRRPDGPALRWWYGSPFDAPDAARALADAARIALLGADRQWTIEQPILVALKNGVVDSDRLPTDSPLRGIPDQYRLGRVQP